MYLYPPIVARQRLGKNPLVVTRQQFGGSVTAVTNTQATTEELLTRRFQCDPRRIKESKRIVLPRTSCFKIRKVGEEQYKINSTNQRQGSKQLSQSESILRS
jgi:hypothetical protein